MAAFGAINHVIGIENGRGYYIRGNVEVDIDLLKEQDVETDGNLCAVCAGKSNVSHALKGCNYLISGNTFWLEFLCSVQCIL
jgi:hypothetical protein